MLLSIIIPAFNAEPYLKSLLNRLKGQLNDKVEIIVIDDGSKVPVKVPSGIILERQENKGAAAARNKGIDIAKGEYISFIDADDMVREDYIPKILEVIKDKPDYIYLSWETFGGGWDCKVKLKSVSDKFPPFNLCCWNRIYRRDMIGKVRFNEKKAVAEDAQFIREVKEEGKKKAFIPDSIYFYRTDNKNSLTKRMSKGLLDMKRIVYYFPTVTKDMEWLIEEAKKETETAEVIVMTNRNDLPKLREYAMVISPQPIKGTELRGQSTSLYKKIPQPIKTQVVIYIKNAHDIGGVETWIYNFCMQMYKLYDIMVIYDDHFGAKQIERLAPFVMIHKNMGRQILCDTLLNMRITDAIPENINAKEIIQVCHTCQMKENYKIQKEYDKIVFVSKAAAESFESQVGKKYKVVPNMTYPKEEKKILKLVSATRLTYEKGEDRIYKMAAGLKENNIPFIWMIFADRPLKKKIDGIIEMPQTLELKSFIKDADYLVQLSDIEAFCYSIVEALELNTPVITTPIKVLSELGFKDGKNGYTIPFNLSKVDYNKIYNNIPKFEYKYDNDKIVKQWQKLLGDSKPTGTYQSNSETTTMKIRIIEDYGDVELGRNVTAGEVLVMRTPRAQTIIAAGKAEVYI